MSDQTYTYGAKYICIRQADDQPGAQYEPIAQCLSGHYDSPSWERHAAFLVEAANSYASSQAEIERLRTKLTNCVHALTFAIEGWDEGDPFIQKLRATRDGAQSALSGGKP